LCLAVVVETWTDHARLFDLVVVEAFVFGPTGVLVFISPFAFLIGAWPYMVHWWDGGLEKLSAFAGDP
jgi:hypothetical protein